MSKRESKIAKKQKRIIYIIMVMMLLGVFAILVFLVFTLITLKGELVKMDDKTAALVGGIFTILSAMFGIPIGKKWWHMVYEEKGKGVYLKVKK